MKIVMAERYEGYRSGHELLLDAGVGGEEANLLSCGN
jgi:hypothetical protein